MQNQTVLKGKPMAIISYFWFIGFGIALYFNNKTKNSFTSFHIRQSFGISLLSLGAGFATNYINNTFGSIIAVTSIILWFIAVFYTIKGEEKDVPLLGKLFQDLFKGISSNL